jgi:hypothetical protein
MTPPPLSAVVMDYKECTDATFRWPWIRLDVLYRKNYSLKRKTNLGSKMVFLSGGLIDFDNLFARFCAK